VGMNSTEVENESLSLGEIGYESLEAYVKELQSLLGEDKNQYDLLVGGGDSGQIVVKLAKLVYEHLGLECPPALLLPTFRHSDYEETIPLDNSQLPTPEGFDGSVIQNVLFLDDEVGSGSTAKGTLQWLRLHAPHLNKYTIVAEDGGFVWDEEVPDVTVEFVSTKKQRENVFNAISYIIPSDFEKPVQEALADTPDLNDKQVMCVLLGLPTKEFNDSRPHFTNALYEIAKAKLPNLGSLQAGYQDYFAKQVSSILEDSK
jgi:hypothetical protein